MSASVDSRIVTMKFDNNDFKQKSMETQSILEKLKASMSFSDTKTAGSNLSKSIADFNLGPMQGQINEVSKAWLAMSTVAITALSNITNRAVNAGIQLYKSLSTTPISEGLKEYETNLNSIQTILANTGLRGQSGLDKVNGALNQLNKYSDQTIYNFSEMARNIGTFTAAGVKLDTAVGAIKGIANLAAISGSSSSQASTAMYQLSQALATGTVKLMDWNSVVNAGMGGKVFQDALKETARVQGVAIDDIIKKNGSFRDSLQEGWLTADILNDTLLKFTGDLNAKQLKAQGYTEDQIRQILRLGQTAKDAATKVKTMSQLINTLQETATSGWAKSFQLIFGDFNEAKKMWTAANDAIGGLIQGQAKARNKILKDWNKRGGRDVAIEAIVNVWKALGNVLGPIRDAFRDIFPAMTGKRLFQITKSIRDFTEGLIASKDTMKGIGDTFRGFFAALDIGFEIIKGAIGLVARLFGIFAGGGPSMLHLTGSIGNVITRLHEWLVEGGKIEDFFTMIGNAAETVLTPLVDVLNWIRDLLAGIISTGADAFFDGIASAAQQLEPIFNDIGGAISDAFSKLGGVKGAIGGAIGGIGGAVGGLGGLFNIGPQTEEAVNGVKNVSSAIRENVNIADRLSAVWDGIRNAFEAVKNVLAPVGAFIADVFNTVKDKISGLVGDLDIEDALALVNTGFFILAYRALKRMGDAFSGVGKAMEGTLNQVTSNLKGMQNNVRADSIMKIAIAIAALAVSLALLSNIDSAGLGRGLGAAATLIGLLVGALLTLEKTVVTGGLLGLIKANSLAIMATAMISLSIGVLALAAAVKILSTMDTKDLVKGITAVAAILAVVVTSAAILNRTGGAGQILVAAAAIGILAVAMTAMAGAIKLFAMQDMGELAEGLGKVALALVVLGISMRFFPPSMLGTAAGLLVVSGALLAIAGAMKAFGGFSPSEMAKSLVMLAGSLVIIGTALAGMTGTAAGAGAILIFAAALAVLVPSLVILGSLDVSTIVKALGALAGVFLVMGVAGLVLAPLAPVMFALAGAIALMGVAMLAAGTGMFLFATGLATLAAVGAGAVAVLAGIAQTIPLFMQQLGLGLRAFAVVVAESGPEIVAAFQTVFNSILDAIIQTTPKVGDALIVLSKTGIRVIRSEFPDWLDLGFELLNKFLAGLGKNIRPITQKMFDIINTMAQTLGSQKNMDTMANTAIDLIIRFLRALGNAVDSRGGEIGRVGGQVAGDMGRGALKAMGGWGAAIARDAKEWGVVAVAKFLAELAGLKEKAENIFGNVVSNAAQAGASAAGGLLGGLGSLVPRMIQQDVTDTNAALDGLQKTINRMSGMSFRGSEAPVVRPILDLTDIERGAARIAGLIGSQPTAAVSLEAARSIDAAQQQLQIDEFQTQSSRDVVYNQYITTPKAPNSVDIYRGTKSQLALATN